MTQSDRDPCRPCEVDAIDASRTIGSTRLRNPSRTLFALQVLQIDSDQFSNNKLPHPTLPAPSNRCGVILNSILCRWTPCKVSTAVAKGSDWASLRAEVMNSIRPENLPTSIELPALPHVVTEFVQKAANPDFDFRVLAAVVEKDSALTVELLKHVNSPVLSSGMP